ncbi:hypothetical protein IAQ61_007579, partial [Plenodomus lingam]|uniref:uncharacterized protein n=1 Tax=Leptosphaeria maculans TaxID=5022 RepID=UPI00332C5D01
HQQHQDMPRKSRSSRHHEQIVPGSTDEYIAIIQPADGDPEVISGGLEGLPGWGPRRGPPTPTYEEAGYAGREFGWREAYPQAHRGNYERSYIHHQERGFGHGQWFRAREGFEDGEDDGWGHGYMGGFQDGYANYGSRYGPQYDDYYTGLHGVDDFGGYGDYPGGHCGYFDERRGHYGHDAYPGYGFNNQMDDDYGYSNYMDGGYGYDDYLGGYDGYNNYYGYGRHCGYGYY